MLHQPIVGPMNRLDATPFGPDHTLICFDTIQPAGPIEYAFMAIVYSNATRQPVYFITSEVNTTASLFGGGSHFLGIFDDHGHANLDASDDWADSTKFFTEAIRLVGLKFGVQTPIPDFPYLNKKTDTRHPIACTAAQTSIRISPPDP